MDDYNYESVIQDIIFKKCSPAAFCVDGPQGNDSKQICKVPTKCACAYSNVRMYSEGLRAYAPSIMGWDSFPFQIHWCINVGLGNNLKWIQVLGLPQQLTTKNAFLGSHSTAQKIVTWILEDFRTKYRRVTARSLTTKHKIVGYLFFSVASASRNWIRPKVRWVWMDVSVDHWAI